MVRNLISKYSGNAIANQFIITTDKGTFFQSYDSVVAKVVNGKVTLGRDWDYSNTTRKYLYQFLSDYAWYDNLTRKEVLKLIKDKEFKFKADLKM